jgi:hypothetical protein
MPLLDANTAVPLEQLREIRNTLIEELRELRAEMEDLPGATPARSARGRTAREIVDSSLGLAGRSSEPVPKDRLVAEINLLQDATIVAAEYYKQYIRVPRPALQAPPE